MLLQNDTLKRDYTLALIAVAAVFVFNLMWPEIIPAGSGFGYDGLIYAEMAARLNEMIAQGELSNYYAKRLLPPFLVRSSLDILGLGITNGSLITAFMVFNALMLALSVSFWAATARVMKFGALPFWLGVAGIAFCFHSAKQAYYYPVLTDSFALMIGCGMVYATLSKRVFLLLALSIAGSFAWQMSGIIGTCLALAQIVGFQNTTAHSQRAGVRGAFETKLYLAILLLAALLSVLVACRIWSGFKPEQAWLGLSVRDDAFTRLLTNMPMLVLLALGGMSILVAALRARPGLILAPHYAALHVGIALLILFVPPALVGMIANPALPAPGIDGVKGMIAALLVGRVADGKVLLPLVAHAVYYGPILLIALLQWRAVVNATITLGPAFVIVLLIFIGLSGFSESRFSFLLWPFVVVIVAQALKDRPARPVFLLGFAALVLLYSKAWLRINQAPWPQPDLDALDQWPKSLYFSHLGPWMNWNFYIGQGIMVILSLGALHLLMRNFDGNRSKDFADGQSGR